jgi:hypothetical protein
MARKSFEVYAQVAAWTGGVAAAAAGGVLLALVSPETPHSIILTLRILGFALIVAVVACGHMQLHSVLVINAYERQVKKDIDTSRTHLRWAQWFMLVAFSIALVALAFGLLFFHRDSHDAWAVVGTSSSERETLVVLGRKDLSTVRTLTRVPGQSGWTVCEISPDRLGDVAAACGGSGAVGIGSGSGARPMLQRMGEPIYFDSGKSTLKYSVAGRNVDLESQACKAKQDLRAASAGGVIIVGRHDQQALTDDGRRNLGSNETLAQLRAQAVANYLGDDSKCGKAVGPIVTLATAPVIIPTGRLTADAIAADRAVEIYGLTSSQP